MDLVGWTNALNKHLILQEQISYREAALASSGLVEYGGPVWATQELIKQCKPLITKIGESKRGFIQAILQLISAPSAHNIDAHILLETLESLKVWILDNNVAHGKAFSNYFYLFLNICFYPLSFPPDLQIISIPWSEPSTIPGLYSSCISTYNSEMCHHVLKSSWPCVHIFSFFKFVGLITFFYTYY